MLFFSTAKALIHAKISEGKLRAAGLWDAEMERQQVRFYYQSAVILG